MIYLDESMTPDIYLISKEILKKRFKDVPFYSEKTKLFYNLLAGLFVFIKELKNSKKSKIENILYLSYLDSSNMINKSNKRRFLNELKVIGTIIYSLGKAKYLVSKGITIALMGHDVYHYKIFNYYLLNNGVKIYVHAGFKFYEKITENKYSNVINGVNYLEEFQNFNLDENKDLLGRRMTGKGTYNDAKKNFSKNPIEGNFDGIVYLHVFSDSPFFFLDVNRIFLDYYEWIKKTLEIINKSNQNWLLKIHPSSVQWGEDTFSILKQFDVKNVKITMKGIDINEVISRIPKIITYSGTIKYETASLGKKSISICKSPVFPNDNEICIIPETVDEYERLINGEDDFAANKHQIDIARKWMIYSEEILPFQRMFDIDVLYRNSTDEDKKIAIEKAKNAINNEEFIKKLGKQFHDC